MKKISISVIFIVAIVFYTIFHRTTSSASSASSTLASTTTAYKNGKYTGSAADAFYGTLQVQATVQNGKLADVQFLQYPHDQHESVEVNQNAMPLLKQEALQVQNANIDVVSGATQTSQAFKESLAAALSEAK